MLGVKLAKKATIKKFRVPKSSYNLDETKVYSEKNETCVEPSIEPSVTEYEKSLKMKSVAKKEKASYGTRCFSMRVSSGLMLLVRVVPTLKLFPNLPH